MSSVTPEKKTSLLVSPGALSAVRQRFAPLVCDGRHEHTSMVGVDDDGGARSSEWQTYSSRMNRLLAESLHASTRTPVATVDYHTDNAPELSGKRVRLLAEALHASAPPPPVASAGGVVPSTLRPHTLRASSKARSSTRAPRSPALRPASAPPSEAFPSFGDLRHRCMEKPTRGASGIAPW